MSIAMDRWVKFLRYSPSLRDVLRVFGFTSDDEVRIAAWARLQELGVLPQDLREHITSGNPLKDELALYVLERGPKGEDLSTIIVHVPTHRSRAWDILAALGPTTEQLRPVLNSVPELRMEAATRILALDDYERDDILLIQQLVPHYLALTTLLLEGGREQQLLLDQLAV